MPRKITAICRKFGMIRQWFYSSEKARKRQEVKEGLVVELVRQERKVNPRAETKKVLFATRSELKRAGISIGINRSQKIPASHDPQSL